MRFMLLAIVLLFLATGIATAADPEVVAPQREGDTPNITPQPELIVNQAELELLKTGDLPAGNPVIYTREEELAPQATRPDSPMMVEIRAAMEAERTSRTELLARFDATRDEHAAMEIQRQIETLARDTELQILRIQVDHARLGGREDLALRIETAIAQMTAPRPPLQPQDRPAHENR